MRRSVHELEAEYQDRIDFHILNVDDYATRDIAIQYQLTGIPLIVLLDADGALASRLEGYQTPEQLRAALEGLLAQDQ